MSTGRFAPSPTGELHLGNLRTALASWIDARARDGSWLIRFEDLDLAVADRDQGQRQLADLAALGLEPDATAMWQSDHLERYQAVIAGLEASGRTYPCFCTRREVRAAIEAAASAPNGSTDHRYPGTCARLSPADRSRRRDERTPALRFRAGVTHVEFDDAHYGPQAHPVDDFVIRRSDGVPAYNLVVIVDDHASGVDTVVRAADLLPSTARQLMLARALGQPDVRYAHVPLVVNRRGDRLAKRDGAVTLGELVGEGWRARDVLAVLARSMGLAGAGERPGLAQLVDRWSGGGVAVDRWRNVWPGVLSDARPDLIASPGSER